MVNQIDLSKADLNLLVLFEAVFEERHLGRAAERLHLTPSAVSHGVGRLRQLLHDPLFLKVPKGVVPTDRATQLAAPIADVLARVRGVIANAAPFEPSHARRRFTVGAPDGASAVFLLPLLDAVRAQGPGIDIGVRQLLPVAGETSVDRIWRLAWSDLDSRAADIVVLPTDMVPLRFSEHVLYEEDFVLVMRRGHAFLAHPTMHGYCEQAHLVVSMGADPHGFVDDVLARQQLARRVVLTVPSFMAALAIVAETDLLCAVPRHFAATHAARFELAVVDPPMRFGESRISAVLPQAAGMDMGVVWLLQLLKQVTRSGRHPDTDTGPAGS
jgi:DNA-binding transcriptional LysR family regulator